MSLSIQVEQLNNRVAMLEKVVAKLQEKIREHCSSPHLPAKDVLMNTTYGF